MTQEDYEAKAEECEVLSDNVLELTVSQGWMFKFFCKGFVCL